MNVKILRFYLLLCTIILLASLIYTVPLDKDRNPFIVDLDFSTDVDDVCAVRVADILDKQEIIDLKAMMLCVDGENIVDAMDGLLDYDEMPEVKIGTSSLNIDDTSPYWDVLNEYSNGTDTRVVKDSVKLYREILSNSLNDVTIVTTGYVTNIAELLKSQPDEISKKSGVDLVKSKVKAIYITGGSYPDGYDNNFFFRSEAIEAINYVIDNCNVPIYLISSNNGAPFTCGGLLQRLDTERRDPVSKALDVTGFLDGRAAWDPLSVWIAACGFEETRTYTERVDLTVDSETGFNTFELSEQGNLFRVQRIDDDYEWYKNSLDNLTIIDSFKSTENT